MGDQPLKENHLLPLNFSVMVEGALASFSIDFSLPFLSSSPFFILSLFLSTEFSYDRQNGTSFRKCFL